MSKETIILGVSILALMVAGFAAYSVYYIDYIKSQSAAVEVKDYTKDFESIKSAISQVNQNLETFESETVKELEQIKSELESKIIQVEQKTQQISLPFEITTNKQLFLQNDAVIISIENVSPQTSIKIELLSSSNELIVTKNVFSDSTGRIQTILQLPELIPAGIYSIQTTYNGSVDTTLITVIEQDASNSESSELVTSQTIQSKLTLILDKEQYSLGDIIFVSGVGPADSSVDLEITDPNDRFKTSHSSSNEDGTYTIIYMIPSDAETGSWKINLTVGNEELETIVEIIA